MLVSVGRRTVIRSARASLVARRVRRARWIRGTTAREKPGARRRGAMRTARGARGDGGASKPLTPPVRLRACWGARPAFAREPRRVRGFARRARDDGRGGRILTDCRSNRTDPWLRVRREAGCARSADVDLCVLANRLSRGKLSRHEANLNAGANPYYTARETFRVVNFI